MSMTTKANRGMFSQTDRWLLLVPIIADILFGLGPFLLGGGFGVLFGFPGNDAFLYRCAGAAAFGYPVGLALGLRQPSWSALRLPIIATLTFNLASLLVCIVEILSGNALPIVYVIAVASIAVIAITASLLRRYSDEPRPSPDISPVLRYGLILGGVLAAAFGVLPLLIPTQFAQLVGYKGTDVFVIRQAGAASLGYGVMAFFALRSGVWQEVRLSTVMALIFNGLGFIASVIAFLAGDHFLIVVVIGAAGLLYTLMALIALQRNGKV
jgi:hypothetical protein